MEKEYTVIVNNRDDLADIEKELTASTGDGPIPQRSVGIANPRPGSRVQTHFMLTDQEAAALESDPRVRAVEIPPEQRTDVKIGKRAIQTGEFIRDNLTLPNRVNWGLQRVNYKTNVFENSNSVGTIYEYAMQGTGVDVVIQDSGIEVDHPEFQDSNGISRVKQIDWYTESGVVGVQDATFYTDYDGHGSHCAGIAAGKTYGWAKDSHIYAQKLGGLEGPLDPDNGISVSDAFDTIRLWHNAKTNGRPTVVNMSWGYSSTVNGTPTSGTYRGTTWTWGVEYTNDSQLWAATGVVNPYQNGDRIIPARLASVDAEVEDMIADGIHVCIAAGNDYYKADLPGGADYDNSVVIQGLTFNYHRGSSPHSDNALRVGNIDSAVVLDGSVYRDRPAASSTRGPSVDIWAPGENIMSVCSNNNDGYITVDYPADTDYKIMSIGGTSMASPQVAGVVAQHLEAFPDATPQEIKARLQADAQSVITDTVSDTDYSQSQSSLMGSPNRMLWSRYGRNPGQVSSSTTVITAPQPSYTLTSNISSINEGATLRITLLTKYVPDGTELAWTMTGISVADLASGASTGTFVIQNSMATQDFEIKADLNTEGEETFTLSLDNGADSIDVIVNDTSTSPPPETFTITVSPNGTSAYTLTGTDRNGAVSGDNATVNILKDDTVRFEVSATGHPFWLKTAEETGTGSAIPGVTNNGAEEATVSYSFANRGTFYYVCEIHSAMAGVIVVG